MKRIRRTVLLGALVTIAGLASAQAPGTLSPPSETLPNPYKEVGWTKLPEGRMWGNVFGVDVDSHGNVWIFERCSAATCAHSNLAPILEFDSSGKFLKSFGQGMFAEPHSLKVDKDDNVWAVDAGALNGRGNQVVKFSPEGKVLLTLGTKGVMGGGMDNFRGPTDVAIAPNGDIFVGDGHTVLPWGGGEWYGGGQQKNDPTHVRIAKFSKDGKFIKSWGKLGTDPGDFNLPHGLAFDSQGRLFVADRGNNRIQIFDQDGKLLETWKQFGKPCSLFIDKKDTLYVVDSDSVGDLRDWKYSALGKTGCVSCLIQIPRQTNVGLESTGFAQGIRIGSAKDGIVRAFLPMPVGPEGPTVLAERAAADDQGNLYVTESRSIGMRKYIKKVEAPEGTGKQIVERACTGCHDFSEFPRVNFDREDWEATVNTMVGGGAPLKDEEIPAVIDYLAANFKGDATPGVVVPGPVEVTINEWDLPTPNSMPEGILHSPISGFTWYAGKFSNVMGRFDPKTQQFKEYHLRPGTNPTSLAELLAGNFLGVIFFTSQTGGFNGRFHPRSGPYPGWEEGDVIEFPIPGPKLPLYDIVTSPNGTVWFSATEATPPVPSEGSKIGTLNHSSHEIKLLDTLTPNAGPYGVAVNSLGVPFFTERNSPRLGTVNPDTMQVTEYLLPNPGSGARGIAVTPDDVIWYTDYARGYLGRFDPKTGKFSEWASPSGPRSLPYGITKIGNIIWYAESGTKPNMLVRFDPQTEKFQSWPVKAGGGIQHIYADADGNLWFTRPLANGIAQAVIKKQ